VHAPLSATPLRPCKAWRRSRSQSFERPFGGNAVATLQWRAPERGWYAPDRAAGGPGETIVACAMLHVHNPQRMRCSWAWMSLVVVFAVARPGVALAAPLELDWDAPDPCPDRSDVEALVARQLGERSTARTRISASGRVTQTANGYVLILRTSTGERRLEAGSCDELAQSAAVILALLIDPHAAPPEPVVNAEPEATAEHEASAEAGAEEPEDEAAAEEPRAAPYASLGSVRGFVRLEAVGDLGFLPRLSVGPGLAAGVIWNRTTIELSGSYFPTQDIEDGKRDVGDVRVIAGRLGVCQALIARPEFGPCLSAEYARVFGGGEEDLGPGLDIEGGIWSLLLAARLWVPFGGLGGAVFEVGVGLPVPGADFTVGEQERIVHRTSTVVGRARTGFELRF
jgi:hypothetical protein